MDGWGNFVAINDILKAVHNGKFTGKPLGQICIAKEKERKVREYCIDNLFNLKKAYSYCDSYSDRFVLQSIGNPVPVAPDKRLRKLSKQMNWIIME